MKVSQEKGTMELYIRKSGHECLKYGAFIMTTTLQVLVAMKIVHFDPFSFGDRVRMIVKSILEPGHEKIIHAVSHTVR